MIKKLALGAIAALLLPIVGCAHNYIIHSPADSTETEEPIPTEKESPVEEPAEEVTGTLEHSIPPKRYSSSNYL